MKALADHLSIVLCVITAVVSQTIIKWRLEQIKAIPSDFSNKFYFLLSFMFDKWFLLAVALTFIAGLLWIVSLTKFELSYAYPWVSLAFILMMMVGVFIFNEQFTMYKLIGTLLITVGIILATQK